MSARSQIEAHCSSYWSDFEEVMLNLGVGAGGGIMGNFATDIVKLVVYGTLGAPLM